MDVLTKLGLFLLLFGLIVFGSKHLLSQRTRRQMDDLDDTVPAYFRTQTAWLVRIIILLVLIVILFFVLSNPS